MTLPDRCARALRGIAKWFRQRASSPLKLVAWHALHGGGMLYVADIDRRRVVFVTTPRAACLLAAYRVRARAEEEVASGRV